MELLFFVDAVDAHVSVHRGLMLQVQTKQYFSIFLIKLQRKFQLKFVFFFFLRFSTNL